MTLVADTNEDLETVGAGRIIAMINISGFKLFLLLRVVDVHTSTFRRAGISVLNSGQGVSRFDLPSALVGGLALTSGPSLSASTHILGSKRQIKLV